MMIVITCSIIKWIRIVINLSCRTGQYYDNVARTACYHENCDPCVCHDYYHCYSYSYESCYVDRCYYDRHCYESELCFMNCGIMIKVLMMVIMATMMLIRL